MTSATTSYEVDLDGQPAVKWKWLKYTWRVLVNLFYLAVVLAVLLSIHDKRTQIIVSIGGLLWAAIRSTAIGQGMYFIVTLSAIAMQIDEIRNRLSGSSQVRASYTQADEIVMYHQIKMGIDATFIGLISIACLIRFFTAL